MSKNIPADHAFPSWFYGPLGEAELFTEAAAVPEDWKTHPSLFEAADPAPAPAPAATKEPKAPAAAKAKTISKKAPTPEKLAEALVFDRAAAITRLHAAGLEVEENTTDAEIVDALKELPADGNGA